MVVLSAVGGLKNQVRYLKKHQQNSLCKDDIRLSSLVMRILVEHEWRPLVVNIYWEPLTGWLGPAVSLE